MAQPVYRYLDAYLSAFCVDERENRAIAEVARLAAAADVTLSDDWTEQLVVCHCYVLAAMEHQAAPDDLFASKLKAYRTRFDSLLPQAIAAARTEDGTVSSVSIFSIPLERA